MFSCRKRARRSVLRALSRLRSPYGLEGQSRLKWPFWPHVKHVFSCGDCPGCFCRDLALNCTFGEVGCCCGVIFARCLCLRASAYRVRFSRLRCVLRFCDCCCVGCFCGGLCGLGFVPELAFHFLINSASASAEAFASAGSIFFTVM